MDALVDRLIASTAPHPRHDDPDANAGAYRGCCDLDGAAPTPAARKASKTAAELVAYLQKLKTPSKSAAAALQALRELRIDLP